MQHWHIFRKWNERLFLEMRAAYKQGRSKVDPSISWYKGEIGFFDYYIIPLAKKLKQCGAYTTFLAGHFLAVFGSSLTNKICYIRCVWCQLGRVLELCDAESSSMGGTGRVCHCRNDPQCGTSGTDQCVRRGGSGDLRRPRSIFVL
jgi:hypothetical protein